MRSIDYPPAPPKFEPFAKIARLSREIIITEKIDGTNAQVLITEDGDIFAGSRKRFITPQDDNFGFARWVEGNRDELLKLGPGRHFGEWWGSGIQRRYELDHKRWSLFNVRRWMDDEARPACCHVVPLLFQGVWDPDAIHWALEGLRTMGSRAAPGFMRPEGIVIYHRQANQLFKKTLEKDELPKSVAARRAA